MDSPAYVHFARRARERFGLVLSRKLVLDMEACIRAGYYSKVCDQGEGVALYRVPVGRRTAAVAYNRATGTVLTIMPVEWTTRSYKVEQELAAARADDNQTEET